MNPCPRAVGLLGPTASGKSGLALALAERFAVEIVSVDSASVYRGLDVGSAKPASTTREQVAHHLIDCVEPTQPYSAAQFRTQALAAMAEIHRRGRLPLLVGGTMLYFKALLEGLDDLPGANPALRAELEQQAATQGWPALHARLAQHDPVSAARLHPHDAQRIQRALEVFLSSGKSLSELYRTSAARPALSTRFLVLGLWVEERAELHRRIARRFDAMLAAGLEQEVRQLRQRLPLHAQLPALRSVGYRQMWQYLEGDLSYAAMREQAIVATRQLAKRQLTWMRTWPHLIRLDYLDHELVDKASARIRNFLKVTEGEQGGIVSPGYQPGVSSG